MLEFVAKYWIEVLFGAICAFLAWSFKDHIRLLIESQQSHEQKMLREIDDKFEEQGDSMQKKMDACYNRLIDVVKETETKSNEADKEIYDRMDLIKKGVLSIESAWFKRECRKLLEKDHFITPDEFEAITSEHDGVYNKLGGNHDGDTLYHLVADKYKTQIM